MTQPARFNDDKTADAYQRLLLPRIFIPWAQLLMDKAELNRVWVLRKVLNPLSTVEAMELLTEKLDKTKSNGEFLSMMSQG